MGYKATDPCLAKVADNEPIFVLRAQDALAAQIVRVWAEEAKAHGLPQGKYDEAMALAKKMDAWPTRKYPD